MRRLAALTVLSLTTTSCGDDVLVVPIVLRVQGATPAEQRVGSISTEGSLAARDVRFTVPRPSSGALAFDEGCFALQVDTGAQQQLRFAALEVVNSRSLFDGVVTLDESETEVTLRPLLAVRYDFAGLASPFDRDRLDLQDLAEALSDDPPATVVEATRDGIIIECRPTELLGATLDLEVVGPGTVELRALPGSCSEAGERACAQRLPPGADVAELIARSLRGPDADIEIEGCTVLSQTREGDTLRATVEPGRCVVRFGESTWRALVTIAEDRPSLQLEPQSGNLVGGAGREIQVSGEFSGVIVQLVEDSTPVPLMAATGDCVATQDLGFFRVDRVDGRDSTCTLTPQSEMSDAFTLDLGDSEVGLVLRPGPMGGDITCTPVSMPMGGGNLDCTDLGGSVDLPIVYPNPTEVQIEAAIPNVSFSGTCVETGPGRGEVLVDGPSSCTVQEVDVQRVGTLELLAPFGYGRATVTGVQLNQTCIFDADHRRCEVPDLPTGSIDVVFEALSPDPGESQFVEARSQPGELVVTDTEGAPRPNGVDCRLAPGAAPGRFAFDSTDSQGGPNGSVSPSQARFLCEAIFQCTADARLDAMTLRLVDEGGTEVDSLVCSLDGGGEVGCNSQSLEAGVGNYALEVDFVGVGGGTLLDFGYQPGAGEAAFRMPGSIGFFKPSDGDFVPLEPGEIFTLDETSALRVRAHVCDGRFGPTAGDDTYSGLLAEQFTVVLQ
ncbi:MAG: hypothetical protein AAF851_11990 [Myxococcota bacterium]